MRGLLKLCLCQFICSYHLNGGSILIIMFDFTNKFTYIVFNFNSCSVIFAEFGGLRILCQRFIAADVDLTVSIQQLS